MTCTLKCDASNSEKHTTVNFTKKFPEAFLNRLGQMFQILCEFLEKIFDFDCSLLNEHIKEISEKFLQVKGLCFISKTCPNEEISFSRFAINANAHKYCLVLLDKGLSDAEKFVSSFTTAIDIDAGCAEAVNEFYESGMTFVRYRCDVDQCEKAKNKIETSWRSVSKDTKFFYRVLKIYHLYVMKISPILIEFIGEFCSKDTDIRDLLLNIILKKTALVHVFAFNEHNLWIGLKNSIMSNILNMAKYSDIGRKFFAALFLTNIRSLHTPCISGNMEESCIILTMISAIITNPSVVVFLMENDIVCKMIDLITHLLKSINMKIDDETFSFDTNDDSVNRVVSLASKISKLLSSCVQVSLKEIEKSSNFRWRLMETTKSFLIFCVDFDKLIPISHTINVKIYKKDIYKIVSIYECLFLCCSQMVKFIIDNKEVSLKLVHKYLEIFDTQIKTHLNDKVDIKSPTKICTQIMHETVNTSFFQISNRVFVEILMYLCVKYTLPQDIGDELFGDEKILMWIGLPGLTAVSAIANDIHLKSRQVSETDAIISAYSNSNIAYAQVQDFHFIQIVISHLDPEKFLKYMLLYLAPSIRHKINLSSHLCSILYFPEFDGGYKLNILLILIYNAMVERHSIGSYENPDNQFLERLVIHSIACGQNVKEIKNSFLIKEIFGYKHLDAISFENTLDAIISQVTERINSSGSRKKISIKPEYISTLNPFYFVSFFKMVSNCMIRSSKFTKIKSFNFKLQTLYG
ncbi:hypothetical protein RF11_03388 [Thelohanellus kitauei]|uniref:Uncharacterized protein n=1 Tax=Thelohanellus kitauei TaxID=669202 RepID=A0A0C2J6K0_THEKT|nr:hypothetical protein RF11_03388 [Thelohanellus kitauei]